MKLQFFWAATFSVLCLLPSGVLAADPDVSQAALVKNAPQINGRVEGSLQMLEGRSLNFNSGAEMIGDLFVSGEPQVRKNGQPDFGGVVVGEGSASPSNYSIMLNSGVSLGRIVTRTDPVALSSVARPPAASGHRWVSLNQGQSVGNWSTLRSLNLNSNYGNIDVPAGSYDRFTTNSNTSMTLGVAGATEPAVYNFTQLTLNSDSQVILAGPVVINVKSGFTVNDRTVLGVSPEGEAHTLEINVYSGDSNINSGALVNADILAPNSRISINGTLCGWVGVKDLTVNSNGLLNIKARGGAGNANQAPTAENLNLTINEDETTEVILSASDEDNDVLTFTILTQPTNGALSGSAPNLTYTPAENFNGVDTFTYSVNDGTLDSEIATVTITVTPVNDAPTALALNLETPEDTEVNVVLSGSDVDGNNLSYNVISQPTNGILSGSAPTLVYTPAENFNGTDSFTYSVNDGTLDSEVVTVTITVIPVNDPPSALALSLETPEETAVNLALSGSDVDGDNLSYNLISQPTNGILSGSAPNLTYTPAENFNGVDTFTYSVNDGTIDSEVATVTITVIPVNDPPTALALSLETLEDTEVNVVLSGSDVDGDNLSYNVISQPTNGALSGSGPNLVYTPAENFNGTDSFTYSVNDGTLDSNLAEVVIIVHPVGDIPVAEDVTVIIDLNDAEPFQLIGSDAETSSGDLQYVLLSQPTLVTFSGEAPSLVATRNGPRSGTETVLYRAVDGDSFSEPARILITVVARDFVEVDAGENASYVFDEAYTGNDFTLPAGGDSQALGRDFWVCFPTSLDNRPEEHKLLLTSEVNTSATISTNDGVLGVVDIVAGEIREFLVPDTLELSNFVREKENKGIHIQSEDDISVFGVNLVRVASEAYLALPSELAGKEYFIASYYSLSINNRGFFSSGAIVALHDDTVVTVRPTANAEHWERGLVEVGDTYDVTLQQGEVHQVIAIAGGRALQDLTGTYVSSNKQINVFGSHECATVPRGVNACDHLVEQLPAVKHWGKEFLTAPLAIRSVGDIHRVISSAGNNVIRVNGAVVATLGRGEFHEIDTNQPQVIEASEKSLWVQYSTGSRRGDPVGDPSMMMVPSIEQYANKYVVQSEEFNFTTNFINVTGTSLALTQLYIDGDLLDESLIQQMGATDYYYAQIPVNPGSHTLESDVPFGCFVYGSGVFDSYAYPGGLVIPSDSDDVAAAVVGSISLTQNATELTQFESCELEITISDEDGNPIANAEARVTLSGSQELARSVRSNNEGIAYYSFQGLNQGVTDISISSGNISESASVNWLPRWFALSGASGSSSGSESVLWSVIGDDTGVIIEDPTALNTRFSVSHAGEYTFQLQASADTLTKTDSVSYRVQANPAVIMNAGVDEMLVLGEDVQLSGSIIANQDIAPEDIAVVWTLIEGDPSVQIESPNDLDSNLVFQEHGTYTFRLSSDLSDDVDEVTITVRDPEEFYTAPQAFDRSYTVRNDSARSFLLVGQVDANLTAEFIITENPSNGQLSGTAPFLSYTPDAGYLGTDSFTYRVYDGRSYSAEATVDFSIIDIEKSPQLAGPGDLVFLVVDASDTLNTSPIFGVDFNAFDPQGGVLTYSIVSAPDGSNIDPVTGLFTWDTRGSQIGEYEYIIRVDDAEGNFDVGEYKVELRRNSQPEITQSNFSTLVNQVLEVTDLAVDDFPEELTYTITSQVSNGQIELLPNGFRYTPNADFTGSDAFTLSVSDGVNSPVSQEIVVHTLGSNNEAPTVAFPSQSVVINLGVNPGLTQTPVVADDTLSVDQLSYQWELISEADGLVFAQPNQIESGITFPALGFYTLQLTVSDGVLSSSAEYQVEVRATGNTAPVVTFAPQPAINLTLTNEATLTPIITDDGLLLGGALNVTWTQLSGAATEVTQNADNSLDVNFSLTGDYVFECRVSDGQYVAVITQPLTVFSQEDTGNPNQGGEIPLVDAGADFTVSSFTGSLLSGSVIEDGIPIQSVTTWNLINGPANVEIANPSSLSTAISFTEYGVYRFALSAADGEVISTDEVVVTVLNEEDETVLSAGSDFTFRLGSETSFNLAGSISGQEVATNWVMLSGFEGTEVVTPSSLLSEVIPSFPGEYVFALQAVNNSQIAFDTVNVTVESSPVVQIINPVSGSEYIENTDLFFNIVAYDYSASITSLEVFQDGVSLGQASYVGGDNYSLLLSGGLPIGDYNFTAVATTNTGISSTTEPSLVRVFEEGNLPLPALFSDLDELDNIDSFEEIRGSAYGNLFINYTLSIRQDGGGESDWTEFANSDSQVVDGVLGDFDPSLLENGLYELRLLTFGEGGLVQSVTRDVAIDSDLKIGHFSLAFEDLTVPLSGVPITVTRAYDSRDQSVGDFGLGWELGLQSMEVNTVGIVGLNWSQQRAAGPFFAQYRLSAANNSKVIVKLPDGEIETFTPMVEGGGQQPFVPIVDGNLAFEPVGDTEGSLEILGNSQFRYGPTSGSFNDDVSFGNLLDPLTTEPFNPTRFIYTDKAGNEYQISIADGLFGFTDINDNTLTFDDNGIYHSDGESVLYTRNTDGLIETITDPSGNELHYRYSGNQLIEFENRVGDVTKFFYENANFPNYLTRIVDPAGNDAIRSEYDEDGRLVRQIDADGNAVEFDHDIANNREIIRDRLGNTTIHEYNNEGYVTKTTDALGGITSYEYDEFGNETVVTTPEGVVTIRDYDRIGNVLSEQDGLGNTTTYDYNNQNYPTSITDALGRTTNLTYVGSGNLASMTDAIGTRTNFGYSGSGNLTSLVDGHGTVTSYTHDTKGRELTVTVTDSEGNILRGETYEYDINGNRTKSTTTRTALDGSVETLVTSYVYDEENRPIETTLPDGAISITEYNSIGQQSKTIDALGREVTFLYDERGNRVLTTYPDGTTRSSVYDVEGRMTSITDQIGNTTYMIYDALGRQTQTILPDDTMPSAVLVEVSDILAAPELADNASTITEYDGDGRVIASIDALGNRTEYEYDVASRRTVIRDALGQETRISYDAASQQTDVIDALSRTTSFQYDTAGRLLQTIFPDATTTQVTYDALGRRSSVTDQEGNITGYEYDDLGRMVAVVDAENFRTEYVYNEQGNLLIQRDAEGRETRYGYDALGRRIGRTLPEGEVENITYNIIGNMLTRMDFNGHTTRYSYDIMNRVTSMTADASHPSLSAGLLHAPASFEYTYDGLGRKVSSTVRAASGNVLYERGWQYNARGFNTLASSTNGNIAYAYDQNGNLGGVMSGSAGGYDQSYDYDVLNRLTDVYVGQAGSDPDARGISAYAYDAVGNLTGVGYGNNIGHQYSYSVLNRLQSLTVGKILSGLDPPSTTIDTIQQQYTYTLNAAGHRTQIDELSGRSINHVFDKLYRLKSETITGAATNNGTISYTHDKVGNRLERNSSVSSVPSVVQSYTENDHIVGDTTDANGNTLSSPLQPSTHGAEHTGTFTDTYDFRNKLIQRVYTGGKAVQISYDTDGNRVSKVVLEAGLGLREHHYLVDINNHTGYAQVVEEKDGAGNLLRSNYYGHDLVSTDYVSEGYERYYHYDGLGSVRALSDGNGDVTDEYTYDAFGVLIDSVGDTPNQYLYTGEQWDADLGMYFLRARYNNVQTGRFHNMDTYEGRRGEPMTLHKYLYAHSNPVSNVDPSGNLILDLVTSTGILSSFGALNRAAVFSFNSGVFVPGIFSIGGQSAEQYLSIRGYSFVRSPSFGFDIHDLLFNGNISLSGLDFFGFRNVVNPFSNGANFVDQFSPATDLLAERAVNAIIGGWTLRAVTLTANVAFSVGNIISSLKTIRGALQLFAFQPGLASKTLAIEAFTAARSFAGLVTTNLPGIASFSDEFYDHVAVAATLLDRAIVKRHAP